MHFYLIYIYNVSLVQQTYNQFSKHNLLQFNYQRFNRRALAKIRSFPASFIYFRLFNAVDRVNS